MNITTWRICHPRHIDSAFSGEGARIEGGRWNNVGTRMVYTSEGHSLAILEIFVHTDTYRQIKNHVIIPATFDKKLSGFLDYDEIPDDWQDDPIPPSTRKMGDKWIKAKKSAVLQVPSTIVPHQFNYLINPDHPDFSKIEIGLPERLYIDPRIAEKLK